MKTSVIAFGLVLSLAAGCASVPASTDTAHFIAPERAVQLAAAAAPAGYGGVFAVRVQSVGTQDGTIYLNSETDYRDQRNLSIAITPGAAKELTARLGSPPNVALYGKRILVKGLASRVTIVFSADGKPTDKYYYQTHVQVSDADQIQLLGQDG
jgi:hypothetical protein